MGILLKYLKYFVFWCSRGLVILGQPVILAMHGYSQDNAVYFCFPEQGTVPVNPAALTEECEATLAVVVYVFP